MTTPPRPEFDDWLSVLLLLAVVWMWSIDGQRYWYWPTPYWAGVICGVIVAGTWWPRVVKVGRWLAWRWLAGEEG